LALDRDRPGPRAQQFRRPLGGILLVGTELEEVVVGGGGLAVGDGVGERRLRLAVLRAVRRAGAEQQRAGRGGSAGQEAAPVEVQAPVGDLARARGARVARPDPHGPWMPPRRRGLQGSGRPVPVVACAGPVGPNGARARARGAQGAASGGGGAVTCVGIIGGSGLDDPAILRGAAEREVSTPWGAPS